MNNHGIGGAIRRLQDAAIAANVHVPDHPCIEPGSGVVVGLKGHQVGAAAISRLACEALALWEANPTLRLAWKLLETSRAEKGRPISPLRNDVRDHGTMQ